MYVCVDFGNTRCKLAYFENNVLQKIIRFKYEERTLSKKDFEGIKAIICVSVKNKDFNINDLIQQGTELIIFNRNTAIPIKNLYKSPETLGLDRLAAAVGAWAYFRENPILIIDLGTAVKYDFVNKEAFIGGMIGPGRAMRFKALHTFTDKLPLLDEKIIPAFIGQTTHECISSGVLNGMLAEINGIIEAHNHFKNLKIILSGGDAEYFESHLKSATFAAPNLVLEGLYHILKYNVN